MKQKDKLLEDANYDLIREFRSEKIDPEKVYDFWDEFMTPKATHVYCCGPKPLMEEIRALSGHWPEDQIHFEDFNPQSGREYVNSAFTVSIKSTGGSFQVSEASTILETLRSNGLRVPSSCESGTCGSCKMRLVHWHTTAGRGRPRPL